MNGIGLQTRVTGKRHRELVVAFTLVALFGFIGIARAQKSPDAAIAPFIDDQTLVVVRVDATRVNPQGVVDWIAGQLAEQKVEQPGIDLVRKAWQPRADRAGLLLTGLRNLNAPYLYWILSVSDFAGTGGVGDFWDRSGSKGVWIVPLANGADSAAALKLLTAERDGTGKPILESRRIGNVALAVARGHIPQPGKQPLPTAWAQALSADSPIQIAVVPGNTLRRTFEENIPTLPTVNGSVPMTTFTRGVQWFAVSMTPPPATKLSAVAQSPDGASANSAIDAIKQVLAARHNEKLALPYWFLPPLENLDTLITFKVDGNKLKWTPDIAATIQPLAVREMQASIGTLASSNMKQILLGAIMYANNNKQFPPDIPALMKEQDLSPGVLKDPLHPGESVGYEYIKPADWQKDADRTPVIYEKWNGGKLVGFADGHVEALESRAAVEKLIRTHQSGK